MKTVALGNNPAGAVLHNVIPPDLVRQTSRFDEFELEVAGKPIRLRALWAGEGFPSDVRRVLERAVSTRDATTVVTARRMSPGAADLLATRGISWADAAGYAEIAAPGLYITRAAPKPMARNEVAAVSWSTSAEMVAEYLLSQTQQTSTDSTRTEHGIGRAAQLAEATRISPGQVAKVLTQFDEAGYTGKSGPERGPTSRRELRDRGRLLSDWAGHYSRSPRKVLRANFHVLSRDPHHWSQIVNDTLGETAWAVSGWFAADAIAPFVTSVPSMLIYVPDRHFGESVDALAAHEDVSRSERGSRIHLRSAPEYVFNFVREARGCAVVSPVRAYADLLRAGGRGLDAGEHLREAAIGF